MRKVILDLAMTLDGYIEGPNGEIDWCIMDDDMDFNGFLANIDTIFYGRVSYDMWGHYQPDPSAGDAEKTLWAEVHSKKKYVFSINQKADDKASYITSGMAEQVEEIKRQPGKDIWLYGGAKLIKTFVHHNWIDVYRISVHPTVLGAGKPLFENLKERIGLTLIETNRFKSGVIQLIYEQKNID